jgi:hypothetical protein
MARTEKGCNFRLLDFLARFYQVVRINLHPQAGSLIERMERVNLPSFLVPIPSLIWRVSVRLNHRHLFDLNPEGFSEKISFDLNSPVLKNVTVQSMQLLYSENNNAKFLKGHDSFAVGGQVSGKVDAGFMTSTPSFTILNWRNEDAILNASAFAVQSTTTGRGSSNNGNVPGEGPGCASGLGLPRFPPCVFGPQGFTNATITDVSGKVHFFSQFLYADFILNNQFKTGLNRFPLNLLLEYENNLNAADHPLDAKGNPTNLGKQSHGYLADFSLGGVKNRNDVQFGYAFEREEQDAIISSFAERRAASSNQHHRTQSLWAMESAFECNGSVYVLAGKNAE